MGWSGARELHLQVVPWQVVAAAPARIGAVLNSSIPGLLLRDKNSRKRDPSGGLSSRGSMA